MDYLVSVLVPIYKVEKYIETCARSLFEQDYKNIEYVFVNDGSPDSSVDLLNAVIDQYPERATSCSIIHHRFNRGLAAACNTAIDYAQGIYVSHVDSDDWLEKDAISSMVKLQQETGADIVSGNALCHSGRVTFTIAELDYYDKEKMLLGILDFYKPQNHSIWRRLIKLSLYKDYHISLKEGINQAEDFQILPRLVYYSQIVAKMDKVVYHYNGMNENSYMHNLKHNTDYWRQDIASYIINESFFSDKESVYKEAASTVVDDVYSHYLKQAAECRERELWEEMKNAIQLRGINVSTNSSHLMNSYVLMGSLMRIKTMIHYVLVRMIKVIPIKVS